VDFRRLQAEVTVGLWRGATAGGGTGDEADLEKIRFDDVHQGVDFLLESGGDGLNADGPAAIEANDDFKQPAIQRGKYHLVDARKAETFIRDDGCDFAFSANLRVVADPT